MTTPAGTSAATERKQELQQHLGHLDALRGIAVLGVILIHTGQVFNNGLYEYLNNPGMRGVQMFFVVSAFTLLLSTQRRKQEPRPLLSFFLRRYFRLAPLYYPFLLLAFYTVPAIYAAGWRNTWPALFFLHGFSAKWYYATTYGGWSLGVEATFYACFPFLLRQIQNLRQAVLWLFGVGTVSSVFWLLKTHWNPEQFPYWSYYSFTVELPVFLFGFVAFYLWRDHLQSLAGKPEAKWVSASLLLLTLACFINIVPINAWKTMTSSVFCVTLLLAVSLYPWRVLVNRVTITLGKLSYSMYLIHGAIVWTVMPWVFQHYGHHDTMQRLRWTVVGYAAIVTASALVASLTYRFIEEPGIVLGRKVVRWVQGRSTRDANLSSMPPLTAPVDTRDAQF